MRFHSLPPVFVCLSTNILYFSTSLQFWNIINVVWSHLHVKYHLLQNLTIQSIPICKPLAVKDPIAKLSANIKPGVVCLPTIAACVISSLIYFIISSTNILKRYALSLQSYLTTAINCYTNVTYSLLHFTQNCLTYIVFIHSTMLSLIPFFLVLYH